MELLNFDNLQAVLEDYGNKVRNLYQDKLITNDRIASGDLLNTVEYIVERGDREWSVSLKLQDYWKYIEEGVKGEKNPNSPYNNPGWKAYPFILDWITIKPVLPRPNKDKRLPRPEQLAYLITRSIAKNGTEGSHDLAEAIAEVNKEFEDKIVYALGLDCEQILKVIVGEIQGGLE